MLLNCIYRICVVVQDHPWLKFYYHSHIKAKKLKRNLVFRVLFLYCVVIDKNNGKKGPKLLPCKRVKQFYQLDNKCHLF